MRREWVLVLCAMLVGTLGAACLAPAPPGDPWAHERAVCEQGLHDARALLGGRATAPVGCADSALAIGGYYAGYLGPNEAWVCFGPHSSGRSAWEYEARAVHEEGHAWDRNCLTTTSRARFAQIMGYPFDIERFADVFMLVVTGSPGPGAYGTAAPSAGQAAALRAESIVP